MFHIYFEITLPIGGLAPKRRKANGKKRKKKNRSREGFLIFPALQHLTHVLSSLGLLYLLIPRHAQVYKLRISSSVSLYNSLFLKFFERDSIMFMNFK